MTLHSTRAGLVLACALFPLAATAHADHEVVAETAFSGHTVRVEIDPDEERSGRLAITGPDGAVTVVSNGTTRALSASQRPAVVVSGRDRLLVLASRGGVQVWDVREPVAPRIIGSVDLLDIDAPEGDRPWDFAVQYPWLFAVGGDEQLLQVVSLAEPDFPEVVDESPLDNYTDWTPARVVARDATLLFVSADGELAAVDASDPARCMPTALDAFSYGGTGERTVEVEANWRETTVGTQPAVPFDTIPWVGEHVTARVVGLDGTPIPTAVTYQPLAVRDDFAVIAHQAVLEPLADDTTFVRESELDQVDADGSSRSGLVTRPMSTGRALAFVPISVSSSGTSIAGEEVVFGARCDAADGEWSFDFGDGSAPTPWSREPLAFHTFDTPGLFRVEARLRHQVGERQRTSTRVIEHGVVRRETARAATKATTVLYDDQRERVWCVNPDNDTISCVDHLRGVLLMELIVGKEPRSIALADDRSLWVTNEEAWSISVIDADSGEGIATIELPFACRPFGVAHAPDGNTYVTTLGTNEVLRFDTETRELTGRVRADGGLRGLAVSGDGRTILATRFVSPQEHGELVVLNAEAFDDLSSETAVAFVQPLVENPGPDTRLDGRGVPNHVADVAITPDGRRAWIAAKKDNSSRGLQRDGLTPTWWSTVRPMAAVFDVEAGDDLVEARVDWGARDFPVATAFSPRGAYGFMAMRGSGSVEVFDPETSTHLFTIGRGDRGLGDRTGIAPIGLVVDPDHQLLVVHNFLTRDLAVYALQPLLAGEAYDAPFIGRVRSVTVEILRGPVLPGKQLFHTANDPRMSRLGHVSCASCHFDSGHDGRNWDFTDRGEGIRNTISLQGRQGVGHGLVHWTANFNEVQDFEQDVRLAQAGLGFVDDHLWEAARDPMGYDKRGLSPEIDAINSYVSTFDRFPPSPYREQDGSLTAAGARGKELFDRLSCWECHGGRTYTDFQFGTVHDLGTITDASGSRVGGPPIGIDTPTLRGIWETAPYFHDGSAATLMDVLEREGLKGAHGETARLTDQEKRDLVAYLLQIDGLEPPAREAVRQPDARIAYETVEQRAGLEDLFVLTTNDWPVTRPKVEPGVPVYQDRSDAFTRVPAWLVDAYRLWTAAEDADEEAGTEAPLLELTVRHDVAMTVGLDARAASLPSWLEGWTERDERVESDRAAYRLFTKTFAAGDEPTFGANPEEGLEAYLVFLVR